MKILICSVKNDKLSLSHFPSIRKAVKSGICLKNCANSIDIPSFTVSSVSLSFNIKISDYIDSCSFTNVSRVYLFYNDDIYNLDVLA